MKCGVKDPARIVRENRINGMLLQEINWVFFLGPPKIRGGIKKLFIFFFFSRKKKKKSFFKVYAGTTHNHKEANHKKPTAINLNDLSNGK